MSRQTMKHYAAILWSHSDLKHKNYAGKKIKMNEMVLVHIPQGVNVHHEPSTNKIKAQIKYSRHTGGQI